MSMLFDFKLVIRVFVQLVILLQVESIVVGVSN